MLLIMNKSSKLVHHPIIITSSVFDHYYYYCCCLYLVLLLNVQVTTTITAFTPTCFLKYNVMYKTKTITGKLSSLFILSQKQQQQPQLIKTNLLFSTTPNNVHDNDNNVNNNENDWTTTTTDSFSNINDNTDNDYSTYNSQRRKVISRIVGAGVLSSLLGVDIISDNVSSNNNNNNKIANAAVGTLPELQITNYIIQGITVRIQNKQQLNTMIQFLQDGFNFQILRKRTTITTEEVWLGYGPEQLSIPNNFIIPISSFQLYGGHTSICLLYEKQNISTNEEPLLYNVGNTTTPGNNIAYIQVGVPGYRISQLQQNNGTILDAYGIVDVISPIGIPIRGIVGIVPDPIMLLAINCNNIKESQLFYEQYLGFTKSEYPYARPSNGTGQFEPPQPKNSIYLSQTSVPKSSMGILLLQNKQGYFSKNKQQKITANPVLQSLNIVYSPTAAMSTNNNDITSSIDAKLPLLVDPSGVPIRLQSYTDFEKEEQETRIKSKL